MENTIFEQVESEVKFCNETEISSNPSYAPTQKDLLELIELYLNSQFKTGNRDSEGLKKHFYNISNFRCAVGSKATDIDTKDIKLIAEEGQSYYPAWFLGKGLRMWMKEKKFGQLINKIIYTLPKYGTVVIKTIQGEPILVRLANLFEDPTADSLEESGFVIERHLYTPQELRKRNWENIEEVIADWRKKQGKISKKKEDRFIEIWERCGEAKNEWLKEGEEEGYSNALFVVYHKAGKGQGLVLHKTEISELPYREVHWEKVPGRWLGKGVMEIMFENQIRMNELVNLKAQGLRWSSLHIFQSRDEMVNRNLLVDTVNGEVLRVRSEITPVAVEERNLAAYSQDETRWDMNSDQKTFSYDVVRGQRAPAGTPLGSSVLQTQMATGYFKMKQEDIGMFLRNLLLDVIIPAFKKKNKGEHILNFMGDEAEIEKLDGLIVGVRTERKILDFLAKKRTIPSARFVSLIRSIEEERLNKTDQRYIKIPKGFYDNIKYKVDIVITGEQRDLSAKIATLQTVLTIIGSNPTILQDPRTRKVFNKILDYAGVSPLEMGKPEGERGLSRLLTETTAQRGGGISKPPVPATTPSMVRSEVKV